MLDWADEDDESNGDSDNTDDNDDDSDRPDSGDFGGSEPFLPPRQDPRGGSSNSKRNSNGGSGSGGSGGQQSHCGHLQFQLAQSPESADTSADLHTRPEHKLCSSDQRDLQERVGTTEESHTLSLAGDAVTLALNKLRSQDTSSQHVADATSGELTSYYAQHSVIEEANIGDCEATADVVSSIKANIGHSEAAAGAASLIKAVLAITPAKSPVIQPYTSVKRQRGSFINHHHSGTSRKGWNSFTIENEANEKGRCSLPDCRHVSKDLEAHMLTHQIEQIPSTLVPDPPIDVDLRSESQAAHSSPQMNEPLRRSMSPFNSQSFLSVKLLGQGGFSTVDEVVHRETSLRVSRKTLKNRNRSALDELKKEVDVLQKLRHPHIVRLLGAYSNGDKMSILLAPVADTTLSAWLEAPVLREPAALAQTIVKMLGCLASSVRYLHEQRPVVKHMDIKPQNILIIQGDQEFPHVVLSDFGISSVQSEAEHGKPAPLTRQYCAPEVSEGISREQAADIWSLGCVFAEMATVAFKDGNSSWLDFRRHFRGRDSKYYWQDVPALHSWLSKFLETSCDSTETTVVRTVKSMLDPEPMHRPDATELTLTFTPAPCCLSWPNDNSSYPGPVEESASVEMFVREDSVDCHAHSHQHGTDDDQEPCDPVSHAKSWIDECAQSHHACHQHSTGPKTLPTRLVDIRPNNATDGTVRIVDSASLGDTSSSIDYISLGYLWDQHEPVLSTDRLQAMRNELGRDSLPRALNEAIAAADRMGYRYLWVDSLCVLQDSEEDKERECLATADVYRNSTLTIVLDQLQNSFSDPTTTQEVSSRRTDGIYDPCSTSPTTALSAVDFSTPGFGWDTRAWALQERFLSPRHLHLGEQQMYWECNALKASETFPRGLPPLLWEKVHTKPSSNIVPKALQYNVDNKLPARTELDVIAKATRRTTPPLSARSTCGDGPIDNVDTCSSNEHQ
jgi:serine/threonine protein kinase